MSCLPSAVGSQLDEYSFGAAAGIYTTQGADMEDRRDYYRRSALPCCAGILAVGPATTAAASRCPSLQPFPRASSFTATNTDGKRLLWIHPMDSFVDSPLSETEDAAAPFWSPDSRYVGFFARGKLKKVDIGHGASEIICDAPAGLTPGRISCRTAAIFSIQSPQRTRNTMAFS
jgi:hypothetical protein